MTSSVQLTKLAIVRGHRVVVHDFSANVPEGTWLGIVGANGSGKTSLLRAVAGRLKIASGQCKIDAQDVTSDRSARASQMGFAPPIEHLPALLSIRSLLEMAGETVERQRLRNAELWEALGIEELLDHTVARASSGMRQRASIAIAFSMPTPIVILDEPFNWLDPVAAYDTRSAISQKVNSGTTVLSALHDLTTLCNFCEQGILLTEGRITLELSREALRAGSKDINLFETNMIQALRNSSNH